MHCFRVFWGDIWYYSCGHMLLHVGFGDATILQDWHCDAWHCHRFAFELFGAVLFMSCHRDSVLGDDGLAWCMIDRVARCFLALFLEIRARPVGDRAPGVLHRRPSRFDGIGVGCISLDLTMRRRLGVCPREHWFVSESGWFCLFVGSSIFGGYMHWLVPGCIFAIACGSVVDEICGTEDHLLV